MGLRKARGVPIRSTGLVLGEHCAAQPVHMCGARARTDGDAQNIP